MSALLTNAVSVKLSIALSLEGCDVNAMFLAGPFSKIFCSMDRVCTCNWRDSIVGTIHLSECGSIIMIVFP